MRVMVWFYELIPKLKIDLTTIPIVTLSLILALSVCYRAKLTERNDFDGCITPYIKCPLTAIPANTSIRSIINECQTCIVNIMKIEERVAMKFCFERKSIYDVCLYSLEDSIVYCWEARKLKVSSKVYHQSFNQCWLCQQTVLHSLLMVFSQRK